MAESFKQKLLKDWYQELIDAVDKLATIVETSENTDDKIVDKEKEIIKAELINSGKKNEMVEKISLGKINKFISDNTLLNQIWIMDPKKKVKDILNENKSSKNLKINNFLRYKVGEGL